MCTLAWKAFSCLCGIMPGEGSGLTLCLCGRDAGDRSRVLCMPDEHSTTGDTPSLTFLVFAQCPLFP